MLKRISLFLCIILTQQQLISNQHNQWKKKLTQLITTTIALGSKLPFLHPQLKVSCNKTSLQHLFKSIDKVSSNYLQLRRFAPYLYKKGTFISPSFSKTSFVIPASGVISKDALLTGLAIPIGIGITYATWIATQKYKAKKELLKAEKIPQTHFDLMQVYEEMLQEIKDEHEQEQSWWEKHNQQLFLISTILFACKSAYKAIQQKLYPHHLEELINYCNDPHLRDFGENNQEQYYFHTTQKNRETTDNYQTRIYIDQKNKLSYPFEIIAHYTHQQYLSYAPFLITCNQNDQLPLPQENNIAINFISELKRAHQKKYPHEQENYTRIKSPLHGQYHIFTKQIDEQFEAHCYHDQAYQQNIDNIQERIRKQISQNQTPCIDINQIAYLILE